MTKQRQGVNSASLSMRRPTKTDARINNPEPDLRPAAATHRTD
jgi:hypothetical protein